MTNEEKTLAVLFSAFGLHTDGFYAVDSSQRGSIDRKLETDLYGANLKFSWLAAPGLTVEPMVSWYSEERGNGTALSKNSTDALDLSLRVSSADGDFSWQAVAWHQRREFESVFSSVNADRSAETLALDQFDVPGRWHRRCVHHAVGKRREVDGQLRRGRQGRSPGKPTKTSAPSARREAGGDQALAGIFTAASYQADEANRIDASARLDWWQLSDGRRDETSLSTGAPLRADDQDDRDGFEPSASIESNRQTQR